MKRLSLVLFAVFFVVFGNSAWAAQKSAQDLIIVTGEQWTDSSLAQKRAFLFGIGNVLEIEQAMAGDNFEATRGRSIVPVLLDGLSGVSIEQIVIQLDKFYMAHPDQIKRAVIEVLYLEMAIPNLID